MQISQINGTKKAFAALTSVSLLRSTLHVYTCFNVSGCILFLMLRNSYRQPGQNVFEK